MNREEFWERFEQGPDNISPEVSSDSDDVSVFIAGKFLNIANTYMEMMNYLTSYLSKIKDDDDKIQTTTALMMLEIADISSAVTDEMDEIKKRLFCLAQIHKDFGSLKRYEKMSREEQEKWLKTTLRRNLSEMFGRLSEELAKEEKF